MLWSNEEDQVPKEKVYFCFINGQNYAALDPKLFLTLITQIEPFLDECCITSELLTREELEQNTSDYRLLK